MGTRVMVGIGGGLRMGKRRRVMGGKAGWFCVGKGGELRVGKRRGLCLRGKGRVKG